MKIRLFLQSVFLIEVLYEKKHFALMIRLLKSLRVIYRKAKLSRN